VVTEIAGRAVVAVVIESMETAKRGTGDI